MPTTIIALLIIVFAILPGYPAIAVYQRLFGSDWRKTDWEKIVNIVAFSIGGLMLYILMASVTKLPQPIYVIPATFNQDTFGTGSLVTIALSFFGHIIGSILVALLWVGILKLVTKFAPISVYPAAWEDFIRVDVQEHWVVVGLTNGEAYAGIIDHVDTSVCQTERDLILKEPGKYDQKTGNYVTTPYQSMFLPAGLISSIATCYDPKLDERIVPINTPIFERKVSDEKRKKDISK